MYKSVHSVLHCTNETILAAELQANPDSPSYTQELGLVGIVGNTENQGLAVTLSVQSDDRTPRGFDPNQYFEFIMKNNKIFLHMKRGIDRDVCTTFLDTPVRVATIFIDPFPNIFFHFVTTFLASFLHNTENT